MSETIYDFDEDVERRGTGAKKYDPSFCPEDVLPFWIVGTDFPSPVEGFDEKQRTCQLVHNEMGLVERRYRINFKDLERKLTDPKVKILSICSPQNPTGRCFAREELVRTGELCVRDDIMIGVGGIHTGVIYDRHRFVPSCSISEEFANHSIAFINPVKTFNAAGFRTTAWFTHNEETYRRIMNQQTYKKGVRRNMFRNVASMVYYNRSDDYVDQCIAYLNETKNQAVTYINEHIPEIQTINPEAAFVIWMGCRELDFKIQRELKDLMFKDARILLNDGTIFGEKEGTGFMRFSFVAPRAVVMEELKRIKEAADRL